jgi:hypothetical protein
MPTNSIEREAQGGGTAGGVSIRAASISAAPISVEAIGADRIAAEKIGCAKISAEPIGTDKISAKPIVALTTIPLTMRAAVYRGVNDVRVETVPVPVNADGRLARARCWCASIRAASAGRI